MEDTNFVSKYETLEKLKWLVEKYKELQRMKKKIGGTIANGSNTKRKE